MAIHPDLDNIGQRIKNLRQSNNLTLEQLANKIGVAGKSTVNSWEKGRTIPNKSNLDKLSKVLNTTNGYLLYGSFEFYLNEILGYILDNLNNDLELKHSLISYLKLTTDFTKNTPGLYFDGNKPLTLDKQDELIDSYTNKEISNILEKNKIDIYAYLLNRGINYDSPLNDIITNIQSYFDGKSNNARMSFIGRARDVQSDVDDFTLFSILPDTLEEFLEIIKKSEKNSNKHEPIQKQIETFYNGQLDIMLESFSENLSQLMIDYHKDLEKYSNK